MGILAGALAAVTFLPTAIPLTSQLVEGEDLLALQYSHSAVNMAAWHLQPDGSLPAGTRDRLGVHHLHVHGLDDLLIYQEGPDLPEVVSDVCNSQTRGLIEVDETTGLTWSTACLRVNELQVVAATIPKHGSYSQVGYFVLALATLVGMITALGVLRLLSPLTQVAQALDKVGAGERGIHVGASGLGELDELVDRVNATARAMEQREDAIMARIQVVQELARMVAHEVRNPLQTLEMLTALVAVEEDPVERYQITESIRTEIRELNAVVHRLLKGDPQRALSLQRTQQELSPFVQRVVSLRLPEAKMRGVKVITGKVSPKVIPIDGSLISRSIENLLINALQAVEDDSGKVKISILETTDALQIVVEDNGPGVDPAIGDQIYEVNVTSKKTGTGLGLALVKGVIEAHGGFIRHDQSPLGGARFTAQIPFDTGGTVDADAQNTCGR
jgi:signal transduction histidine kinase